MTPVPVRPPRIARWLLARALPVDAREYVIGDLDEEFARHRRPAGPVRARAWYWSQAIRSALGAAFPTESSMVAEPEASRSRLSSLCAAFTGDVFFALRLLRRSPGYTAAALLTFGLGVGAAIAIFSAVNDVMLRPLPYPSPDRLAMLWESNQARGWNRVEAAPANLFDWRERAAAFEDIAFVNPYPQSISLMTAAGPVRARAAEVSGNLFSVLGVPPLLGRTFRDEETFEPGIVVLSYEAWRRHFSSDPAVVGRMIRLDGQPHEVIGVMGPAFVYPITDADVWRTPARLATRRQSIWWRQAHVVRPIGRLAPGATFDQAAAELRAIAADLARQYPDTNTGMEAGVAPMQEFLVGDRRRTLLLLLGAVGILQLIACANVANLMLGRAVGRQQELAVRAALGAARGRLVRQTLTESLVLAAGGTVLGLGIGAAGLQLIAALTPPELDAPVFRADWRLAAFTLGACVVSAVIAGTWPAWRSARVETSRHLEQSRSSTAGRRRLLAVNGLVAFEIALAVLLVAGAGLMVRSLGALTRIDPGIDARNVLTFQVHPSSGSYPDEEARARFAMEFTRRIESLPGVEVAGAGRGLPMTGYSWTSDFTIDRWAPDQFGTDVRHREATASYFTALKVPLRQGRLFDDRDLAPNTPLPVVVNQAFVDRYFPNDSPVGRRVVFDRAPTERSYWYPIVGVVGNERKALLMEPVPEIIAFLPGDVPSTMSFVVRTAVPPLSLVSQVRSTLADLDREAPLLDVRTMEQVVADARAPERFLMTLFAVFAAAALVLAAVGVYGVANQAARARTREVGIRLALGASGTTVVRQLVLRAATVFALGLAAGVAAALATGDLMTAELYQVDPRDPMTLIAVVSVIGTIAFAATVWPTWRAAQVDPASVLRSS